MRENTISGVHHDGITESHKKARRYVILFILLQKSDGQHTLCVIIHTCNAHLRAIAHTSISSSPPGTP